MQKQADLERAFAQFWAAYPRGRKQAKIAAKRLFLQIVAGKHRDLCADAETIIKAAALYAKAMGDNNKYVIMPTRWLREGRWEDDDIGGGALNGAEQSELMAAFDELQNPISGGGT